MFKVTYSVFGLFIWESSDGEKKSREAPYSFLCRYLSRAPPGKMKMRKTDDPCPHGPSGSWPSGVSLLTCGLLRSRMSIFFVVISQQLKKLDFLFRLSRSCLSLLKILESNIIRIHTIKSHSEGCQPQRNQQNYRGKV